MCLAIPGQIVECSGRECAQDGIDEDVCAALRCVAWHPRGVEPSDMQREVRTAAERDVEGANEGDEDRTHIWAGKPCGVREHRGC